MKFSGFLFLFLIFTYLHCSLLAPPHEFPVERPHSYDPGSAEMDTASVCAILKANNIPLKYFDSVVQIESDWRVHVLDLQGMKIDTISNVIGNMGALDHLDLSNNNLKNLPDSIVNLNVFYQHNVCDGSIFSNECRTETINGLIIKGNYLCAVSKTVSNWIDNQYGKKDYILSDSTQKCDGK
jgi:hypothetical protein